MLKMRSKMQNQKGFTLVELMVVVVIIGILVAIAVPVYNAVTERADQGAATANARILNGSLSQYLMSADGLTVGGDYAGVKGQLVPNYISADDWADMVVAADGKITYDNTATAGQWFQVSDDYWS